MPGDDLFIADDGDYDLGADGQFVTTPTAQPSVRHQILDRLGEWIGDPTSGRERRGIAGRNNSEAELEQEEDTVIKALEVLEVEGLITDIETAVDRDERGRFGVAATSRDTQAGGTIAQSTLTEFGV